MERTVLDTHVLIDFVVTRVRAKTMPSRAQRVPLRADHTRSAADPLHGQMTTASNNIQEYPPPSPLKVSTPPPTPTPPT